MVGPLNETPGGSVLWHGARLFTGRDGAGGVVERGAVLTAGTRIVWAGPEEGLPGHLDGRWRESVDLRGALLTPGLVDCHTHLVYAGSRADEFERRLQGTSYEEIARAGGGIQSTVRATRAASDASLLGDAGRRARHWIAQGVTTLEIKSGYGLALEHERRMLQAGRRLAAELPLEVRCTYLAAHTVPTEYRDNRDGYVEEVIRWLGILHAEGLVDAVDAFCERIAFDPPQVRRIFDEARKLGLPVKLHAEQISNQHGARLAAQYAALSCDHLEYLDEEGIAAMARSGTVAVLLPGAYYFLREQHKPPVAALRAAGVPIAIATDHNPGTSPLVSPLLAANLACVLFGLSPREALLGLTSRAAQALGLQATQGSIAEGQFADLAIWDAQSPADLVYYAGGNPLMRRVFRGCPDGTGEGDGAQAAPAAG